MSSRFKFYEVDMESSTDPYGSGIGFRVIVLATSKAQAKNKANKAWPTHPLNMPRLWSNFRAHKVRFYKHIII